MTQETILAKVQEVFRAVFKNDSIVVTMETTANDIEEWDSLTHMQLITAEQEAFGIKFKLREILSWKNVGDMVRLIAERNGN